MATRSTPGHYKPKGLISRLRGKVRATFDYSNEVFSWGGGRVHISRIQSVWHDDWDRTALNVKFFDPDKRELALRDGDSKRLFCDSAEDARGWRNFLQSEISFYATKKFQLSCRERPVHYKERRPGETILNSRMPRRWKCSRCFRTNEPDRASCTECGREKRPNNAGSRSLPPKVFVAAADAPLVEAWSCKRCTYTNERTIYQCEVCKHPNVPDLSEFDDSPVAQGGSSAPPKKPSASPKRHEVDSPHFIDFSTSGRTVSAPPGSLLSGTSLAHTGQAPPPAKTKTKESTKPSHRAHGSEPPPDFFFEPLRSVSSYAILEEGSSPSASAAAPSSPPPTAKSHRADFDAPQLSSASPSSGEAEAQPLLSSSPSASSLQLPPPPTSHLAEDADAVSILDHPLADSSAESPPPPRAASLPPPSVCVAAPPDSAAASPPQSSFARAPSLGTCVICLDAPITHVVVPCGHACMCEPCAARVRYVSKQCPICRARIHKISRLVFPPSKSL